MIYRVKRFTEIYESVKNKAVRLATAKEEDMYRTLTS